MQDNVVITLGEVLCKTELQYKLQSYDGKRADSDDYDESYEYDNTTAIHLIENMLSKIEILIKEKFKNPGKDYCLCNIVIG